MEDKNELVPMDYAKLTKEEIVEIVRFENTINNKRPEDDHVYLLAFNYDDAIH